MERCYSALQKNTKALQVHQLNKLIKKKINSAMDAKDVLEIAEIQAQISIVLNEYQNSIQSLKNSNDFEILSKLYKDL